MTEIWKNIEGYENLYQISSIGRVRSLDRFDSIGRFIKGKILKPRIDKDGYHCIFLSKNGTQKPFKIHRLVAQAFIPNPDNKPCIDHVNCVRSDNRLENLRWVTYLENNLNPITRKRSSDTHREIYQGENNPNYGNRGKNNPLSKPIVQLTLDNEIVKLWFAAKDAEREKQFDASTITKCCRGKKQTHKNYKWQYVDDWLADWWDNEMDKAA